MAPELFVENGFHSFASDLYALGCVVYEMVSGRTPFSHVTSFGELQRTVVRSNPPEPTNCSSGLCDLLRSLLERNPCNRLSWRGVLSHEWVVSRSQETGKPIPSEWHKILKEKIEPVEARFADKYPFSSHQPSPRSINRSYSIDSSTGCGSTTPKGYSQRYTNVTIRE